MSCHMLWTSSQLCPRVPLPDSALCRAFRMGWIRTQKGRKQQIVYQSSSRSSLGPGSH